MIMIDPIKNHFEKHKKTHAAIVMLAVLVGGAWFAVSKINAHAEATIPDAPILMSATAGDSSVTVEWTAGGDGGSPITSFLIEDTADGGRTWSSVATAMARESRGYVSGLTNGTPYNFRVRAINDIGQSNPSNESGAVTPNPGSLVGQVTSLSLVPNGDATGVLVSWIAPEPGTYAIAGYRLSWTNGDTDRGTVDFDLSNRSYTVTGLTPGRSYIFSMYVRDVEGNMGAEVRYPITMPGGAGGDKDDDHGGGGDDSSGDTLPTDTNAMMVGSAARVTWNTLAATGSYIAYGLDPDRLSYTVSDDTAVTEHSKDIDATGVPSCTTLFYKIYGTKSDFDARSERGGGLPGLEKVLVGSCRASVIDVATSPLVSRTRSSVTYGTPRTPTGDKTEPYFQVSAPEAYSSRVETEAVFQLKQLDRTEFAAEVAAPEGTVLVSDVLDAKAYPDRTETISEFDKSLDVSMSYLPELVDGLPIDSLSIWRSDDGVWTKLSGCSVDTDTEVITCQTDHFSIFTVFAESDSGGTGGDPDPEPDTRSASSGGCRCVIQGTCVRQDREPFLETCRAEPVSDLAYLKDALMGMMSGKLLKIGMMHRGEVAVLQVILNQFSPAEPLVVDGSFGTHTLDAVLQFQELHHLKHDGLVGPETRQMFLDLIDAMSN